ncbi:MULTISPECIES: hypothetical protein [Nostocales]|uniref:Uncharacterized protein n=3 Tax=Nostocales TaxID=1161 RepID=A0A0C1R8A5_9CYAN|nr:hypothetical protein [Tolypothrix bouteillei]KAF3883819.1 hypothetical protein DA73_0400039600 [Tolypothrix bouteillei VB521301]
MTRYEPLSIDCLRSQQHLDGSIAKFPCSFAEAVAPIETLVFQEFNRQIIKNQLYYHAREHINTDVIITF